MITTILLNDQVHFKRYFYILFPQDLDWSLDLELRKQNELVKTWVRVISVLFPWERLERRKHVLTFEPFYPDFEAISWLDRSKEFQEFSLLFRNI